MATELTDDRCDVCGFRSSERTREEAIALVAGAAPLLDDSLGPLDVAVLNRRPDGETWSMLEYVEHIREVFRHSRLICEQALDTPGEPYEGGFPPAMSEEPAGLDRREVIAALGDEAALNAALFRGVEDDHWGDAGLVSGMEWTIRFALPHICHELLHHRADIVALGHGSS